MDEHDILVREAHHRCSNDLQMVTSLLQLMARRAADPGVSEPLLEAANRVRVLASARAALALDTRRSLGAALEDIVAALRSIAAPRSITLDLTMDPDPETIGIAAIAAIGLGVNELATNAIKHAFDDGPGHVTIALRCPSASLVSVTVVDDGAPFDHALLVTAAGRGGLGLSLTQRLLAQHNGTLIMPADGSKIFEIVVDAGVPAAELN